MKITVKLFAILKDKAGVSQIDLEVPSGKSVADAAGLLVKQYPTLEPLVSKIAFAVNEEYVAIKTELHDGDELAFIPPVSGG